MGYYVNIVAADFGIPRKKWNAAFEAVAELNEYDGLKTGGRWGGGKQQERWFAWMDADYPAKARQKAESGDVPHPLMYVFERLGFEWEITAPEGEDEELRLVNYDSKTGGEDHFLEAVAHFVTPGSFLEWRGEEGELWIQRFNGETMTVLEGRIVYDL